MRRLYKLQAAHFCLRLMALVKSDLTLYFCDDNINVVIISENFIEEK